MTNGSTDVKYRAYCVLIAHSGRNNTATATIWRSRGNARAPRSAVRGSSTTIEPTPPAGRASPNVLVSNVKANGSRASARAEVPSPNMLRLNVSFTGAHFGLRNTALNIGKNGLPVKW